MESNAHMFRQSGRKPGKISLFCGVSLRARAVGYGWRSGLRGGVGAEG